MSMFDLVPAIAPFLDLTLISMLAVVLWRLGHDPTAAWREREDKLKEIVDGLRVLVAQAEGQARELDVKLQAYRERQRGVSPAADRGYRGASAHGRPSLAGGESRRKSWADEAEPSLSDRVRELVQRATPIEEIARRLDVPPAEVRVLVGLQAARGVGTSEHVNGGNH